MSSLVETDASWKTQTTKYLGLVKDVDSAAQKKDADGMKKGKLRDNLIARVAGQLLFLPIGAAAIVIHVGAGAQAWHLAGRRHGAAGCSGSRQGP